jgi:hypothetical protein
MERITKIVNSYLDENSHYLLQAFTSKHRMSKSLSLRKMIECAIVDYNEDKPFYDFSTDINGCYQKRLPYKIGAGITDDTYKQLERMKDEIGVSSVSTLFRRIVQTMIIDYWMSCYQGDQDMSE